MRFGHFLSGEAAQYWSLIRGRTYFHSVLYDEQNEINTYKVESYNALGSKASHGCIRLTVPDARWIWYNISYDTVCEIRDGSKDDADDVSYETLKAICGAVSIPVVAIGGITQENVAKLAGSGICGVAVISAIYAAKNIQQASADLKAATEKMLHD